MRPFITISTASYAPPNPPSRQAGIRGLKDPPALVGRRLSALLLALIVTIGCFGPVGAVQALAEPNTTVDVLAHITEPGSRQNVIVDGEVVGDIIYADAEHKWLLLQGNSATISVYVSNEDALKVGTLGRYGQRGCMVEVRGEFVVECADHNGLTDIHAVELVVLDPGQQIDSPPNANKLKIGGLLLVVGLGLIVLQWRLRERTR